MKDHVGCFRGFTHYNEAWYAQTVKLGAGILDEIHIGFYSPEGGTTGEFTVEWIELSGREVPRLRVFDDAWDVLARMSDLLGRMADLDNQNVTPQAFCKLLLELGFEDRTARKPPSRFSPEQKALQDERARLQARLDELDRQIAGVKP